MVEVSRDKALAVLRSENPACRLDDLVMYVDAAWMYREATANILEHGSVVAHPRTGQPLDNPYVKIRSQATSVLLKLRRVRHVTSLW